MSRRPLQLPLTSSRAGGRRNFHPAKNLLFGREEPSAPAGTAQRGTTRGSRARKPRRGRYFERSQKPDSNGASADLRSQRREKPPNGREASWLACVTRRDI